MPTISDTRIANMALSHVGTRSSIESLEDEISNEAEVCRLWYEFSRRQTLEGFDWNFARKRITLTKHSEDPPDGVWGFRYVYPADCIVARKLENPTGTVEGQTGRWIADFSTPEVRGDAIPFEVETDSTGQTKSILSNLSDAKLVYTFEQLDTGLYSPLFVEALSRALGSHIAFTLTGKLALANALANSFTNAMFTASASSANEQVAKPPRDADFIRGRV